MAVELPCGTVWKHSTENSPARLPAAAARRMRGVDAGAAWEELQDKLNLMGPTIQLIASFRRLHRDRDGQSSAALTCGETSCATRSQGTTMVECWGRTRQSILYEQKARHPHLLALAASIAGGGLVSDFLACPLILPKPLHT